MFVDIPYNLILVAVGAFLLGWILSAINSRMGDRLRVRRRDPRDDRIRELEAELRIAHTNLSESRTNADSLAEQLKETTAGLERRDTVISEQQEKMSRISQDLKDSVVKTRELRAELAQRATENVHAEAKIREVETELSVAQASSDMIATGVLDYSLAQDAINSGDDDDAIRNGPRKVSKTAV